MAISSNATQKFVPIKEVRDGIMILRDNSLRSIVMASSINFALKSQDEQIAILAQFQSFLNTLDFSLQIYIQSRKLDIKPYLELLASREEAQSNDLMRVQLREYMDFIRSFTKDVNIMTKSFFLVVPYTPVKVDIKRGVASLLKRKDKKDAAEVDLSRFEEYRTQLEQRIAIVQQGLSRVGIRTITLGTDEVVDLFYHLFNPGESGSAVKT